MNYFCSWCTAIKITTTGGGWLEVDSYRFLFVFTLKFGENAFQAYGAQLHPQQHAHHTHAPTLTLIFCTMQRWGATKTALALSNFTANRYLRHASCSDSKHVCQTDAKCIWISVKGCGDSIWMGAEREERHSQSESDGGRQAQIWEWFLTSMENGSGVWQQLCKAQKRFEWEKAVIWTQ